MTDLGNFALHIGLFLGSYAVLIDLLGAWRQDNSLIRSGRNATVACLGCLTVAMLILWVLLFKCDFSVKYVAEHTSRQLPLGYRFSALWAGAAGSLLLWLWLQSGFVVLGFCTKTEKHERFAAGARAIANLVLVFFLIVLIFDKNPFDLSMVAPKDGAGLNPLLQHPAMVLHPPTLFIGYAAFAVPFAWAFAYLKYDRAEDPSPLLEQIKRWILWAWMFLTIGIVLGAWWAYEELGWGGYWAWDPVENSSLMPWLTATALLHCSRTFSRKTSMATWLLIMSIVTYSLCVFGTFLTRYGLVSSVHAFPDPGLGILFMVLLVHIAIISIALFIRFFIRRKAEPSLPQSSGLKVVIFNNWLLVLLTFVILVGTLFPFLSGLVTSQKITLKPEYFTKITAPIGIALLFIIGICPYLWRKGIQSSRRTTGAVLAAVIIIAVWIITRKIATVCLVTCGFAAINLAVDFIERYMKKSRFNLRWLGARIVHIGVVLVFMGIAGSGGYNLESQQALKPGEEMTLGNYRFVYETLRAEQGSNFEAIIADVSVYKLTDENDPTGHLLTKLSPSKAFYDKSEKPTSEVAIDRTLGRDVYIALDAVDQTRGIARLKVLINPLINWIWLGSTISMLGTILVLISFYKKKQTVNEIQTRIDDE